MSDQYQPCSMPREELKKLTDSDSPLRGLIDTVLARMKAERVKQGYPEEIPEQDKAALRAFSLLGAGFMMDALLMSLEDTEDPFEGGMFLQKLADSLNDVRQSMVADEVKRFAAMLSKSTTTIQ